MARLVRENFPPTRFLSVDADVGVARERFADGEIAGGSVYDALVGAAAIEHGTTLVTLDRRASRRTCVLGVEVDLLSLDPS